MTFFEIIIISISLSMDAFVVSICKGLTINKNYKNALIISLYFGLFQAFMPIIGYLLGSKINGIQSFDHYVIFILLLIIGLNMIIESNNKDSFDDKLDIKTMIALALATSIDALAVGITFAFLKVKIVSSILIIGIITSIFSFIGVLIGNKFSNKFNKNARILGGVLLILMGIKILLEHIT